MGIRIKIVRISGEVRVAVLLQRPLVNRELQPDSETAQPELPHRIVIQLSSYSYSWRPRAARAV